MAWIFAHFLAGRGDLRGLSQMTRVGPPHSPRGSKGKPLTPKFRCGFKSTKIFSEWFLAGLPPPPWYQPRPPGWGTLCPSDAAPPPPPLSDAGEGSIPGHGARGPPRAGGRHADDPRRDARRVGGDTRPGGVPRHRWDSKPRDTQGRDFFGGPICVAFLSLPGPRRSPNSI